jgi:hypothetical protein
MMVSDGVCLLLLYVRFSNGPSRSSHGEYRVGAWRIRVRSLHLNSSLDRDRSETVILERRTKEG